MGSDRCVQVFEEYLRIEQLSESYHLPRYAEMGKCDSHFCEKHHRIGAKFLGDYIVGLIPLFSQMGL